MEPHVYGIELAAGEYVRIGIVQNGADVEVVARSPAGQEIAAPSGPWDRFATETVSILGEAPGLHVLEVRRRSAAEASGGYAVSVEELRAVEPRDRQAVEAERAMADAYRLASRGRREDLAQALALYRRAEEIWQELGESLREAAVLSQRGLAEMNGGEPAAAVASFERALSLQRGAGALRDASYTLNQIGRAWRLMGELPRALEAYQEALEAAGQIRKEERTLAVYFNLGRVYQDLGRFQDASESYTEALELNREAGDRAGEALALLHLAGLDNSQGRPVAALSRFEQALAIARPLRLPEIEIQALTNLGALYRRLGQPHAALESFAAALDLVTESRSFSLQGPVMVNLGSILVELGDFAEGRELLSKALPLLRDPREEAAARISLGRTARSLGESEEALGHFERALELQRGVGDRHGEALGLRSKAFVFLDRGEAGAAKELLLASLALTEELGDPAGEMETRRWLGRAESVRGDFPAADRSFERALALSRALGDPAEEARILLEMARSQQARGTLAAARENLESALAGIESLRSEIAGDHLRASHFAAQREAYEMYVDVLLQLQREDPSAGLATLAFETAERARARGILDFLGQARVDVREGDPALLAEERRLRLEMNAKAALRKEQGAAALEKDLTALSAEYRILEARLQASSPRYARLKQPEVRLAAIQREALDGETVLLEYFLAEPRSYLWIVTSGSLASVELPGRARIEELARRVHERLGRLDPTEASQEREDLKELSRILLGPALDRLKGRRVAVVADGALLYLPFSVLPVPMSDGSGAEVPLIVEHEVVHLPSAAVLRELRRSREERPRPPAALAVLADPIFEKDDPRLQTVAQASTPAPSPEPPPSSLLASVLTRGGEGTFARLPWTRKEAEVITAEAVGRDILLALDFRASRDLATAEHLGRYRILHFATHGVLDTRRPALSGLVLSQVDERGQARDGFLRLHDVYHLRLNADLVVLSGCETALGKTMRGEGIIGLTRGFFHAGASAVTASLWPVRDRATAELMQRFYRGMFRDGLPASAALRQAQVSMWRERQWRDPYFWAAFVLQGDWRAGR